MYRQPLRRSSLIVLLALALPVPGQEAPPKEAASPPAPKRPAAEEEFAALQAEFAAAQAAYYRPLREAQTDAQRAAVQLDPAANPYHEFRPRFQALADKYPGTPTELNCLVWICSNAVHVPTTFAGVMWQLYTAISLPLQVGLAALVVLCVLALILALLRRGRKERFARSLALVQLAVVVVLIVLGWQAYIPAGRLGWVLIGLAALWLLGVAGHVADTFRKSAAAPEADPAPGKPKASWPMTVANFAGSLAPMVWAYGIWRDQPVWRMPLVGPPEVRQAEDRILRTHGQERRLGDVLPLLRNAWAVDAAFFRRTLDVSPHREVQGVAAICLAEKLRQAGDDDGAAAALERVRQDYADLPWGNDTLGAAAEHELDEMQTLVVGRVAPDIEGEDVDGVKFKLSDYRGKVVVLDFWGDW
jgi:hypothetical protein